MLWLFALRLVPGFGDGHDTCMCPEFLYAFWTEHLRYKWVAVIKVMSGSLFTVRCQYMPSIALWCLTKVVVLVMEISLLAVFLNCVTVLASLWPWWPRWKVCEPVFSLSTYMERINVCEHLVYACQVWTTSLTADRCSVIESIQRRRQFKSLQSKNCTVWEHLLSGQVGTKCPTRPDTQGAPWGGCSHAPLPHWVIVMSSVLSVLVERPET